MSAIGLAGIMFAGPAAACPDVPVVCDSSPVWSYDWVEGTGTFTVTLAVDADSAGLCEAKTLHASSYKMPSTWDRNGFSPSAVPQYKFDHKLVSFDIHAMSSTQTVVLNTPACGPFQVDLYEGKEITVVGSSGHSNLRASGMVSQTNCPDVTPATPTRILGTCLAEGTVTAIPTADYTWEEPTGPIDARVYTAKKVLGGPTLLEPTSFTFDLSKLPATDESCLPDVIVLPAITSAAVTPVPPTCLADGSLTLTDGDGFTWGPNVTFGPGTYDVTATAKTGYSFAGDKPFVTFPVTVLAKTPTQSNDSAAPCYLAPVIVPPDVVPPVLDPPAVVTPVITPVAAVLAATPATLAVTGIDGLPWMLLGAAGLIGLGGLALTRTARARRVRA